MKGGNMLKPQKNRVLEPITEPEPQFTSYEVFIEKQGLMHDTGFAGTNFTKRLKDEAREWAEGLSVPYVQLWKIEKVRINGQTVNALTECVASAKHTL